jgi:putative glutamine amidotransferase
VPPLTIGITCSPLREAAYYDSYQRALEEAGAEVVRVGAGPGGSLTVMKEPLARVDGLLFPGGWDIDPSQYGQAREVETGRVDPAEDTVEVALARAAVAGRKPLLGICRGQQLLNVALGGTLHQHVAGHTERGIPRNALSHSVEIAAGSSLAEVAGAGALMVNSTHHQAVWRVAADLLVTARSPDGVIEGLESADRMVVAVQCHPEELTAEHAWARAFFAAYLDRVGRAAGVSI